MNFSDIPFPENIPTFVHHSDVKEYLWNYSKAHSLEKFIRVIFTLLKILNLYELIIEVFVLRAHIQRKCI